MAPTESTSIRPNIAQHDLSDAPPEVIRRQHPNSLGMRSSRLGSNSIPVPKPSQLAPKIRGSISQAEVHENRLFPGISAEKQGVSRPIRVGEVHGSNPCAPTQKTQQNAGFFVGRRPARSAGDWAQTLECVGVARLKSAFEAGMLSHSLHRQPRCGPGSAPGALCPMCARTSLCRDRGAVPVPSLRCSVRRRERVQSQAAG
jgi:hypothetical protein